MASDNAQPSSNKMQSALIDCMKTGALARDIFLSIFEEQASAFDARDLCRSALALSLMGERALIPPGTPDVETYRFTWLRTFHAPISVRAIRDKNGSLLTVRALNGQGGLEFGELSIESARQLPTSEWRAVTRHIAAAHFWAMEATSSVGGMDGATWLLEGYRPSQYHAVLRWSPEGSGDDRFHEACVYLLNLADLGSLSEPVY